MADTRKIYSSGRYLGEVNERGDFYDAMGKYIGSLDEHRRFFDENHVYRGEIDELGRCFGANGEWLGDGSDSFIKQQGNEEEESRTEQEQYDPAVNAPENEETPASRVLYLKRSSFIKWMIALVVMAVICIQLVGIAGILLAYALVAGFYGSRIMGISVLDAMADSLETGAGSFFTGLGGVIRLTVGFFVGWALFIVHAVKAVIAIIHGEI